MIKEKVNTSISNNEETMFELLGIDLSYDVSVRKLNILDTNVNIYFVNSLIDTKVTQEILKSIFFVNNQYDVVSNKENIGDIIENSINHLQVSKTNSFQDIITNVLCGLLVIFVDNDDQAIIIDSRSYPSRSTSEPPNEISIRGSRDGFVENIIVNTGLVRRRIRDNNLRFEMLKLTDVSKTDISVCYIEGVADKDVLDQIKQTLYNSNLKNVIMGENVIYECLLQKKFFPLPAIKQTERPDTFAAELSKGKIGIIVDNSPTGLILPISILDLATNVLEHTEPPFVALRYRIFNFLSIIVAATLLPIWIYITNNPSIVPEYLDFILIDQEFRLSAITQVIIILIFYDLITAATFHAPTITKGSVSLSATFLLTVAGSEMKLFSPEATLFVVFTHLISSAIPSRNLAAFYHYSIYISIILTQLFGLYGFIGFIILIIIYLARQRTYGVPFMYPIIPFNFRELSKYIYKKPVTK